VSQSATGELITGKVGQDLTPEDGYKAAQRVVLSLLATLKGTRILVDSIGMYAYLKALFCGSAR
jgi:hypothetical protein